MPAFFTITATHLMIDCRSIRGSGISWRLLAENRAEVVQRESSIAGGSIALVDD